MTLGVKPPAAMSSALMVWEEKRHSTVLFAAMLRQRQLEVPSRLEALTKAERALA